MPDLSVIIPIFNTSSYLERCLDCICGQSLKNIEIICINDASSDNSLEIIKQYANLDKRILCITLNNNRGASTARNIGIAAATGNYIGFIDSDDSIDTNFYESLYVLAEKNGSDVVKGNLKIQTHYGGWIASDMNDRIRKNRGYFLSNFGTAIYRRSFILNNELFFPAGLHNGEDLNFIMKVVSRTPFIQTIDETYYYYWYRENSSSKNISSSMLESMMIYIDETINYINKRILYSDIYNIHFAKFIDDCFVLMNTFSEHKARKICAKKIIYIYQICRQKDNLSKYINETYPLLLYPILKNDYASISIWNDLNLLEKLRIRF